ncbi:MAG: FmdB family zinc ribbon protein [Burkholderiaceae bacterium]
MPIYAYKCDACGHAKDVLQKMSDPQLTDCPSCGQATFKKQLTAAGFQLKGTGWYVTDFREGGGKTTAPAIDAKSGDVPATTTAGNSTSSESNSAGTAATTTSAPSAPAPAASKAATSTSAPAASPASSV